MRDTLEYMIGSRVRCAGEECGEVGIRRGERVHAVIGQIGRVKGLAVVPPDSVVTHVLLDEGHLWGRKRVAIPIGDVTGIDDDGVAVRLSKDQIKDLPPVDTRSR